MRSTEIRDRPGLLVAIKCLRDRYPFLVDLFADGGHTRNRLLNAVAYIENLVIDMVR